MITVKCTYSNNDTVVTSINGTLESAKEYFVGQWFNFGDTEEKPFDDMQQCIKVELVKDDVTSWENKVLQFLQDNNNELVKLDHDKQEITFRTLDYDKGMYTTSYDKLNMRMEQYYS